LTLLAVILLFGTTTKAFLLPFNEQKEWSVHAFKHQPDCVDQHGKNYGGGSSKGLWKQQQKSALYASSSSEITNRNVKQNNAYIQGLMSNLGELCDKVSNE
jgi:hypothetical protein